MYIRKPRKFENPKMTKKKTLLRHVMREAHRLWKKRIWLFFGECLRDAWMNIRSGMRKKTINVAQVSLF
ncbi:hypothetical protein FAES_2296 [Fibrella aestuarina BUZ 2]|uniref:Uncharacterized protein n=2 Tax=Fibrella TaxID=861914 RepID=I0K852_9BACT|nr:hypothetical protein [Fibrella aestuarina]CCH00305.1 hypothetical protein FAES_2296 [Fibrella aestuarina BUZ 2]